MSSGPGALYLIADDVTKDVNGSRLYGHIIYGIEDATGSFITKPIKITETGALLVDIGSSINLTIGSIVMDNAIEIQDNDTGYRLNINSGAANTSTQLAGDIWTNGGVFNVGSGTGSDIDFPFTAQTMVLRFDQDISFYLKPYTDTSQLFSLSAVDGEFRIEGVELNGIDIQTVSTDTNISFVIIEALDGTYYNKT